MVIRFPFLLLLLSCLSFVAHAEEEISICYNYDCALIVSVSFDDEQMNEIHQLFETADDAESEREVIAIAIGLFESYSGMQTPTWADKGANLADDGVDGRMDCHDESGNTTNYLRLLERKGWLKFHRVEDPVDRFQPPLYQHWAAHIVEKGGEQKFVVDSWFFDNGYPAAVFALEDWKNGVWPD